MGQRLRHDELKQIEGGGRTVSRRAFFNRARLGLIAVAGVTVFGIASTTGGAAAAEDDEDEKKEKSKPRDKDQEAKEKEEKQKKSEENSSNTKKKKKNTNGDDSKKKKKVKTPASPYQKYVEKGKDRYGCTDFPNQFDSQQVLRLEPKDPNNLDGNRNGVACDGQDAFMDGVPVGLMSSPFDLNPVPRP